MRDVRNILTRANWSIGNRTAKRFVTVHYNGPEIAQNRSEAGWVEHLDFIARFHMGPYLGADGIQYHYAILPDGTICHCRDESAVLWHCANGTGNNESLAIHFPLGGVQQPSSLAWAAFTRLADDLIARHRLPGRHAVYGHRQWPYKLNTLPSPAIPWQSGQSACPGNQIMALLESWKATTQSHTFTVRPDIDFAAVREGPARWYNIAWSGVCTLPPGREITCDEIVLGETIGNNPKWAHWPAGGFIHTSLFE